MSEPEPSQVRIDPDVVPGVRAVSAEVVVRLGAGAVACVGGDTAGWPGQDERACISSALPALPTPSF